MSYNTEPYYLVDLDYYFNPELQFVVRALTKYLRRHICLWKYVDYSVDHVEISTSKASILITKDELRVALHILKHNNAKYIPVDHAQVCMYIETLIGYTCNDFLRLYVMDNMVDHFPVNLLMSYTRIERITACRCLEYMNSLYMKYPTEKGFPYHTLHVEAQLVDTSKICKKSYEAIRNAIHPKCKNFHVNILLSSIVHISHTTKNPPKVPTFLNESSIREFFESVHIQFMLALVDCNTQYEIIEYKEAEVSGGPKPLGNSIVWEFLESYKEADTFEDKHSPSDNGLGANRDMDIEMTEFVKDDYAFLPPTEKTVVPLDSTIDRILSRIGIS